MFMLLFDVAATFAMPNCFPLNKEERLIYLKNNVMFNDLTGHTEQNVFLYKIIL